MKKHITLTAVAIALILAIGSARVRAEAPEAVTVTVTGVNYALIDALAKGEAPASEALAKLNALQVTEAKNADGEVLDGLAGKTLHYLPTKAAAALIVGEEHQGATVSVEGKLFVKASVLAVSSFEVVTDAGGDDEFGDFGELPVNSMSNQPVL